MKFLLSTLVIIGNLNVLLSNNDNCRENDLNALMVRLRQLRTEFNNLKIQHDDRIDQINATQAVLKEANDTQETELKKLRQEFNHTSSEFKKLRQEFHNTSSELDKLRQEFHNTSSELDKLRQEFHNTSSELEKLRQEFLNTSSELEKLRQEFHNTSSELDKLRQEFHNTSSELEKLRQNTSSEIAEIKDKSFKPIVGFNARLSSTPSESTVSPGNMVVFDTVITNQGEGYNSSTGIFTAPYTGLYFFSAHFCHYLDKFVFCAIYQESKYLARSSQYGDNSTCSSVSTIAMVKKGEQVWVEALLTSNFLTDTVRWNAFSGSLINK